MELINLATELEDQELSEIATKAYDDFLEDDESRQDHIEKHAEYLRLYYQEDGGGSEAWQGSSKESIPLLTEGCNQFESRAYKAFFPSRTFIEALPMDDNSLAEIERADKIAKHMSYQLTVEDRSYKPDKSQMFLATALHGS